MSANVGINEVFQKQWVKLSREGLNQGSSTVRNKVRNFILIIIIITCYFYFYCRQVDTKKRKEKRGMRYLI
jgi:hypothetical protein